MEVLDRNTDPAVRLLLERALLRLRVRRGSFALDPSLGSRLHRLPRAGDARRDALALEYAREALAPRRSKVTAARTLPFAAARAPGGLACAVELSLRGCGSREPCLEVQI